MEKDRAKLELEKQKHEDSVKLKNKQIEEQSRIARQRTGRR